MPVPSLRTPYATDCILRRFTLSVQARDAADVLTAAHTKEQVT